MNPAVQCHVCKLLFVTRSVLSIFLIQHFWRLSKLHQINMFSSYILHMHSWNWLASCLADYIYVTVTDLHEDLAIDLARMPRKHFRIISFLNMSF